LHKDRNRRSSTVPPPHHRRPPVKVKINKWEALEI
jgi:hypothetical protein